MTYDPVREAEQLTDERDALADALGRAHKQLERAVDDIGQIAHALMAYDHAPVADRPIYRLELLEKVREVASRHIDRAAR